tara:strand:- start:5596 stop:6021 length:426 start_codon:yes stop_codon:yes gene_type:complete
MGHNKYKMTLIYKIVDNTNGNVYVGSTNQKIHRRMNTHKQMLRCSSSKIIKNNNYSVYIIEECDNKDRNKREEYWIKNLHTINIKRNVDSFDLKEYKKEYTIKNKEHKKQYDKIRREWKMSWGETKRDVCNLTYTDYSVLL